MPSINDLNMEGARVLVRVDFNVPLNEDQQITDDSRMQAHIPSLKAILAKGGRPIVMSHLGRPKGGRDPKLSLAHLVDHLKAISGVEVQFINDCIGEEVEIASKNLPENTILLLENLRFHDGETKGDENFAYGLSKNGDFYINDAFGTAHRAHASTAIIANYFSGKKAFGLVMKAEIDNVNKVLNGGQNPITAIVGGAKVSSKISVLENLLPKIDHLVIGGGMAFTFLKAQGASTGNSLVEDDFVEMAAKITQEAEIQGVKIHLPVDAVIADDFNNSAKRDIVGAKSIPDGWMGLDAGPETISALAPIMEASKTILWNGPMGVFEFENFSAGTKGAAELIAKATSQGAFSLVGGGDSVAAIKKFNMAEQVSYVSTGGGAMLEFLEGKTLPGIAAIQDK
ncbi:MAG: phosphoglycerate kinase [Croceimicrobium sp.]